MEGKEVGRIHGVVGAKRFFRSIFMSHVPLCFNSPNPDLIPYASRRYESGSARDPRWPISKFHAGVGPDR